MSIRLFHLVLAGTLVAGSGSAGAASLVRLEKPGTLGVQAAGFQLTRDADVRIEAVGLVESRQIGTFLWPLNVFGESRKNPPYVVRAWILDAASRKPVWTLEGARTTSVAESPRLRRSDASIRLVAGRYELYLSSDVAEEEAAKKSPTQPWWDRAVEYFTGDHDPLAARCFAALSADALKPAETKRYEVDGDLPGALIRLNRTGDSALRTAGFELRRPATLRVYGLVEQVRDSNDAADFGWIVDAVTRKVAWQCWSGERAHAGGSAKNRLVDELVHLETGRYLLRYGTDDSHSHPVFNASPPYDPFNWGITLAPGPGFEPASFTRFTPVEPDPLVAITEVGDDETAEKPFRLERDAGVRVHALGEWTGGERFNDFATILEARTKATVWTMSAADTIPAGGARKNRLFEGLVRLRRGDYILRYRSDDSHSYPRWNASSPFEPRRWGVTLYPEG